MKMDLNKDGVVDIEDVKHLLLRYEIIALGGALLIVLPILNTLGYISVDSNFFWDIVWRSHADRGISGNKTRKKKNENKGGK